MEEKTTSNNKKRIFLIDSENVGWNGVKGFEMLNENDAIYYFASAPREKEEFKITVDQFFKMQEITSPLFKRIHVEPNGKKDYLDDCIKTLLGYLFSENKDCEAAIVSNDHGYKATIEFWNDRNRSVKRVQNIESYLKGDFVSNEKEEKLETLIAIMEKYTCGGDEKQQYENAKKVMQMKQTKTINKFCKSFNFKQTKRDELSQELRQILQ